MRASSYIMRSSRAGSRPSPRWWCPPAWRILQLVPYGAGYLPFNGVLQVEQGARVAFALTTIKDAHVACFYTDTGRRTARVFPNPQRLDDRVVPPQTLILPGGGDVFVIEAGAPGGTEIFTCAANDRPWQSFVPTALQPDFTVAPQLPVRDAAELQAMLSATGATVKQVVFEPYQPK